MNWLNLNITVLDSEEFLGAEPVQRATWLCLLRYCIGQENGGRIKGALPWTDRKWQQVVRVTGEEVAATCDLWTWDGEDLVVAFYPTEKEVEVRTKRESGRRGGQSRHAAKVKAANDGISDGSQADGEALAQASDQADGEAPGQASGQAPPKQTGSKCPTERKGIGSGKEGEGNGNANRNGNDTTSPAPSPASRVEPMVDDCVLHARHLLPTNPDFAASVGRQFHALFARKHWRTSSGEDLLHAAAWKYRLNQMVEEESRKDLAKHPYAAASLRTRSEGRGW
jgi:hypothetical protein